MANNFDENTMNNIKNMVDNGDLSGAISQISPEMIENFSKMMNNNSSQTHDNANENTYNFNESNSSNNNTYKKSNSSTSSGNSGFDFSNIDMNTLMKMKSIMDKMNNKNDPSYNLLYSLKPYLRESKQEKLDQYANLLNFSKIAEAFNDKKTQ